MGSKINDVEREKIILDHLTGMGELDLSKKYKRSRLSISRVLEKAKDRIEAFKQEQREKYRELIEAKLDLNTVDTVETLADGIEILKLLRGRFLSRLRADDPLDDESLPTWMNTGLKYVKEMNMLILAMQKGQAE